MNINQAGVFIRHISLLSTLFKKNHYDALGLTSKATQSEIKSAYYKLSMMYHPDKNKGEEIDKFREITAAYEVLGNTQSRKLYDRGMNIRRDIFDGSKTRSGTKTSTANFAGRVPIYDFDQWSRVHYGQTIEKRTVAKAEHQKKMNNSGEDATESTVLILLSAFAAFMFIYTYSWRSLDEPPTKKKNGK